MASSTVTKALLATVTAAALSSGTLTGATSASAEPAQVVAAPASCPRYYFCGYAGANYTNLVFKFTDCYLQPIAARTGGSWYNNQSNGTTARMYDINRRLVYTTPGAPYGDTHGDWRGIRYIDAC
ncbi:hypothetical protein [Streptomyces sp. NPDC047315]|uniref:hypothetical protein n=1 Tax=Streptomyces sp. NPDC047315 TaxID=3155142 RepID=UPI003404532D